MKISKGRAVAFFLGIALVVSSTGFLLRAEPPQPVGTWASIGTADPQAARTGAAVATLADGTSLVAGGLTAEGVATDSIVIHDPLTNSSSQVGQLLVARVNAAATRLDDGRVLVTGGIVAGDLISAEAEVFDPATGASTFVSLMSQPRTGHASARLADGTVLIVGGTTVDGAVLSTTERFDPSTNSISPAASMAVARTGTSATTLIDGRVLVAGGYDGAQDLASAEIYQPFDDTFIPVETAMSMARSGHAAVLLPHNNSVLIAGGTSADSAVTTTDLFLPAMFPDPYSWGMGTFGPTDPVELARMTMVQARSHAVAGPWGDDGYAFAIGGGASDGEVYRFVTIKTDKDDYAPGELAVITGSGWEPGEGVKLVFQEDPAVHTDYVIDNALDAAGNPVLDAAGNPVKAIVADENGDIYYDQWAPDWHDLGVRFYLMAVGETSQRRAQTTFTDDVRNVFADTNSGVTTSITATRFTANELCTGTSSSLGAFELNGTTDIQIVNGSVTGNLNGQSLRLTANASATTPATSVFSGWTSPDASTFVLDQYSICIPGSNGTNATETFTANYSASAVTVAVSPESVLENSGTNLVYSFTRSGPTSSALTVSFTVGGTASDSGGSTDYVVTTGGGSGVTYNTSTNIGSVVIPIGSSSHIVTVDPSNDVTVELNETVILTLNPNAAYGVGSPNSATGTITNDDGQAVSVSVAPSSVKEDGATNLVYTFTRPSGGISGLTVNFSATGTASYSVTPDYSVLTGATVTLDAATGLGTVAYSGTATTATVTVDPAVDATVEADETVVLTVLPGSSYSVGTPSAATGTINNDDQTITVTTPAPASAIYGDSFGVVATASSTLAVAITTTGSCSGSGSGSATITMTSGTGTCTVRYNQAGNATYNVAPEVTSATTAAKRAVTVTVTAGQTKVYGNGDPAALAYTVSGDGLASGDVFAGALVRAAGEDVGLYAITQGTLKILQGATDVTSSNYTLTFVGANFEITKRPITVTVTAGQTKVYGNGDPAALAYTVSGDGLAGGDVFAGALVRAAGEDVGLYAITQGTLKILQGATDVTNSNYTLTFVGANFEITKRPITVTVTAGQTKVYGDGDPALTFTTSSLGTGVAVTGVLARAAGETVAGSPYAITQGTVTNANNPNYTITFVGANLTITARPITVTADAQTKVYGDGDPALTFTTSSLGTGVAVTGVLARAAGETVAGSPYAITQGTVTNANNPNYTITFVGANLTITARPITVTADAQTKVYGDGDPALTFTTSSLGTGVAVTGVLARAAGETVAGSPYAITQGTVTNANNPNYTITFVGANLTITARPITVTADAQTKVYGDGDPALTFTTSSLGTGVAVTGVLARAAGETVAGSPYAITQGTVTNANNPNYTITFVGANLTITARPITVTADAQTKVYGDGDPALTFTTSSLGTGVAVTGVLARAAGETVAGSPYAITQGTVTNANNPNYTITFVGANLTITARPTTTTLASSLNLSVTPVGVNLTATVAGVPSGGPTPVGSVTFTDSLAGVLGTASLSAGGVANLSTIALTAVGQHVITASYTPSSTNFSGSTSTGNTAPAASITGPATGSLNPIGTLFNFTGQFTDATAPIATAAWSFDGTVSVAGTVGGTVALGTVTKSYAFATPGVYSVVLTVNDNLGGITIVDTNGVSGLMEMVVVYDPNGGFVTGGGWIDSPVGAYAANPSMVGKANFGFVAKYKKGATVPEGQTEFQFHAAGLNFKSTAYQWLVVQGTTKAQYKGTGTVNGSGTYQFLVSVVDGSPDKFRMKITNGAGVIYDNLIGGGVDDAEPTTALGGGSIVIHAK